MVAWLALLACGPASSAPAPAPAAPEPVAPAPPPAEPAMPAFSCETAAAALGFPGATVAFCREATVLRGVFRLRLEGTPTGRLDRALVAENGVVSTDTGMAAFAAFLRRSALWGAPKVYAEEVRDALDAFDARPAGFDRASGPRAIDDKGKPIFLELPALKVVLETGQATWAKARGGGVSHAPTKLRATLTGSPSTTLVWVVEQQAGAGWAAVETIPLEP